MTVLLGSWKETHEHEPKRSRAPEEKGKWNVSTDVIGDRIMNYSRVWNGPFYMSEHPCYLVRIRDVCSVSTVYPV